MNRQRGLQIFLVVVVILVWYFAGKRVITYSSHLNESQQARKDEFLYDIPPESTKQNWEKFRYTHTFRNPFVYEEDQLQQKNKPTHTSESNTHKKLLIPFTLVGLTLNADRAIALVRDAYGNIYFVSPGDTVKTLVVQEIVGDSVVFHNSGGQKGSLRWNL